MTQPDIALELTGVQLGYKDLIAIWDASLAVGAGRACGIVGPNGAGKSTLCSGIAGVLKPRKGTVTLFGKDVSGDEPWKRAAAGVAFVPEGKRIFRALSVEANVTLAAQAAYGSRKLARDAIDEALAMFPVLDKRRKVVAGSLSGGQQQMVAVAQAMATHPRLLIVDEPSSGLAPVVVEEILAVLADLKSRGVTIILVEQPDLVFGLVDDVVVVSQGRISASGPVSDLDLDALAFDAYLGVTS